MLFLLFECKIEIRLSVAIAENHNSVVYVRIFSTFCSQQYQFLLSYIDMYDHDQVAV